MKRPFPRLEEIPSATGLCYFLKRLIFLLFSFFDRFRSIPELSFFLFLSRRLSRCRFFCRNIFADFDAVFALQNVFTPSTPSLASVCSCSSLSGLNSCCCTEILRLRLTWLPLCCGSIFTEHLFPPFLLPSSCFPSTFP